MLGKPGVRSRGQRCLIIGAEFSSDDLKVVGDDSLRLWTSLPGGHQEMEVGGLIVGGNSFTVARQDA